MGKSIGGCVEMLSVFFFCTCFFLFREIFLLYSNDFNT